MSNYRDELFDMLLEGEEEDTWKRVKKIPMKELVKHSEWQQLRESLKGTWSEQCAHNTTLLRKFIEKAESKANFCKRVRIVYNYLTGSYFRINNYRLCSQAKALRKKLAEVIKNERYSL